MGTKKIARTTFFRASLPEVRTINTTDLIDALKMGISDFNKRPTHYIFLCITYPILMIIIARIYAGYDVLPMVFPVIAGSTLLGPFAACGMYELSRRMEKGMDYHWTRCFSIFRSPAILGILALGAALGVLFLAWLFSAQWLYSIYFEDSIPESISAFMSQIFTTTPGWTLIIVGCGVGFVFSVMALAISVVSFPFILDHHVDPMT
ncbi:MAG: DUF2189 domain-containing protein, partial [Sneathiella sp.]|nr:DUF2189 domain-containing protein [Sneathiella sp.]